MNTEQQFLLSQRFQVHFHILQLVFLNHMGSVPKECCVGHVSKGKTAKDTNEPIMLQERAGMKPNVSLYG